MRQSQSKLHCTIKGAMIPYVIFFCDQLSRRRLGPEVIRENDLMLLTCWMVQTTLLLIEYADRKSEERCGHGMTHDDPAHRLRTSRKIKLELQIRKCCQKKIRAMID